MAAWISSQCFQGDNWKFVVRRLLPEMENYSSDLPKLPI